MEASEQANKILDYLTKSKKQVGIHDPVFEAKTVTKAEETPKTDPFDAMINDFEHPEAKAKAKTVSNDPFDKMVAEFEG